MKSLVFLLQRAAQDHPGNFEQQKLRRGCLAVLLMLLLFVPARAFARPVGGTQPPAAHTSEVEYYWDDIMIWDGVAVGLAGATGLFLVSCVAGGDYNQSSGCGAAWTLGLGMGGVYAFASPTIHWRNNRKGAAATSFLLRTGLPLAVGFATDAWFDEDNIWYTMMGSVGLAMGIDWIFLAHHPADQAASATIAPVVMPANAGATFGVTGSF